MALLEGARAGGRGPHRRGQRVYAEPRHANSISTACSRRKRSARASSPSSTPLAPHRRRRSPRSARGRRCSASSSSRELDLRPESQREWLYVVRGLRRRRPAARRRLRAARRALRSRDQHRRTHDGAARFRAALPDAVSRASSPPPRATQAVDEALLFGLARQEIRFVAGHRVLRRRGRADAADAGDRTLGREADRARATTAPSQIADAGTQHAIRRVLLQVLAGPPRAACRRSRPLRIMRARAARRPGAPARRSKARSGSRRFRSTKPATT